MLALPSVPIPSGGFFLFLLSVDPGVKTGVALLNGNGDIVWTVTCDAPYDALRSALSQYPEAEIVVEQTSPRLSYNQTAYHRVVSLIERSPGNVTVIAYVRPTEWKGHPTSVLSNEDMKQCHSIHERDAVRLGRFYLSKGSNETVVKYPTETGNARST